MTQRYYDNRARGVRDRLVAKNRDRLHNDAMSKAAEDFFADIYGLPHDNSRRARNSEFVIKGPRGCPDTTIDVKWTDHPEGRLIHFFESKTRSTIYVLVIGKTIPEFRVVGWAWGKDLHANLENLGYGPTYALTQDRLRTNTDLMMACLGIRPVKR